MFSIFFLASFGCLLNRNVSITYFSGILARQIRIFFEFSFPMLYFFLLCVSKDVHASNSPYRLLRGNDPSSQEDLEALCIFNIFINSSSIFILRLVIYRQVDLICKPPFETGFSALIFHINFYSPDIINPALQLQHRNSFNCR